MSPRDNRNARLAPGVGRELTIENWKPLDSQSHRRIQPLFTARPRGTRWAVAAISIAGETVKLGDFPRRAAALSAAGLMARARGGVWLP